VGAENGVGDGFGTLDLFRDHFGELFSCGTPIAFFELIEEEMIGNGTQ